MGGVVVVVVAVFSCLLFAFLCPCCCCGCCCLLLIVVYSYSLLSDQSPNEALCGRLGDPGKKHVEGTKPGLREGLFFSILEAHCENKRVSSMGGC